MRRRFLGIVLSLLFLFSLIGFFNLPRVKSDSNTITVPDDFPTIQAAVDAASDGDTVFVRAGTYYERVVMNKTLTLLGENRSNTIIWTDVTWEIGLTVQANDTVIKELTIEYLYLSNVSNTLVEDDNIRKIHAEFSGNSNLSRNSLVQVTLRNCSQFFITENLVDFANSVTPYVPSGLVLEFSSNNTISKNAIVNGTWVDEGSIHLTWSTSNTICENNFMNNSISVWFVRSDNNTFYHNNFTRNYFPFSFRIISLGNVFDAGYPAGGNYYDDFSHYSGNDSFRGVGQNETGSDGLGDTFREWYQYVPEFVFLGRDSYPLMKPYCGPDDIGAIIKASKTVLADGYNTTVAFNVTVINYGEQNEDFNFTFSMLGTSYETPLVLESGNSTVYGFALNTTGFTLGNYTAWAYVSPCSDETDTSDNNRSVNIRVVIPGDVSSTTQGVPDGIVNMRDIAHMIVLFNTKPSSINWNPNADVNDDNTINMRDIAIAVINFNKHE
jgi:parallel beta-helix repeat protein